VGGEWLSLFQFVGPAIIDAAIRERGPYSCDESIHSLDRFAKVLVLSPEIVVEVLHANATSGIDPQTKGGPDGL
jgi:hypothetical protein